jgi:translation initiation factor IF-1
MREARPGNTTRQAERASPENEGASEALVALGVVREALPNALYRVELAGGARSALVAHVAGDSSLLRLRPGDAVVVEIAPYDAGRGRIVRRR